MTEANGNLSKSNQYRIAQLEKSYDKMDEKIDLIMTNHLPHIQNELIKLSTQIKVLSAINIGAVIIALLLQKIL